MLFIIETKKWRFKNMRYRIKKSKLEQFKKENKDKVINTVNIDEKYIDCYIFDKE